MPLCARSVRTTVLGCMPGLISFLITVVLLDQAQASMCDSQISGLITTMETAISSGAPSGSLSNLNKYLRNTLPLSDCTVQLALHAFSRSSFIDIQDDMGRYFAIKLRNGSVVTGLSLSKNGVLRSGYVKVE